MDTEDVRDLTLKEKIMDRKIITLCGSTRFKEEFEQANKLLTYAGYIVLTVGCFNHADELNLTVEVKEKLDDLHFDKIRLSDEVLIINKDGYIGRSTYIEYVFARKKGKDVLFWQRYFDEKWQIHSKLVHPIIKKWRGSND